MRMCAQRFVISLLSAALLIGGAGCSAGVRHYGPESASFGSCSPTPCVKVFLSGIPLLSESLPEAARQTISRDVAAALYAPLDIEANDPSADSLIREVNDRYEEYSRVSDAPIDWVLKRSVQVVAQNPLVVSMEVSSEGYLGGAHGFKERSLLTFDAQSGARLAVSDVVDEVSRGVLVKIVEFEFRRVRQIPQSQSLQDAGFFILPGQEMPLSENFAFTSDGVKLHYNPYEVGPYVMGETNLVIPREAIEPILKPKFRGVFDAQAVSDSAG